MGTVEALVLQLAVSHPYALAVLTAIGFLRLINKPLMTAIKSYVLFTPSKTDDLLLEKIEKSKTYVAIVFIIDWLGSIKVGKTK